MTLSNLMANYTPDPDFTGIVNTDDYVLAIDPDPTATEATADSAYLVVEKGIEGQDAQLNGETSNKKYLRAGTSTIKTGQQRTFSISGDRYVGDEAQDYLIGTKHAHGNDCITNYLFIDVKTGKGEKGQVSIIVNSDGSGNAGSPATIGVDLKQFGALTDKEYVYSAV